MVLSRCQLFDRYSTYEFSGIILFCRYKIDFCCYLCVLVACRVHIIDISNDDESDSEPAKKETILHLLGYP